MMNSAAAAMTSQSFRTTNNIDIISGLIICRETEPVSFFDNQCMVELRSQQPGSTFIAFLPDFSTVKTADAMAFTDHCRISRAFVFFIEYKLQTKSFSIFKINHRFIVEAFDRFLKIYIETG